MNSLNIDTNQDSPTNLFGLSSSPNPLSNNPPSVLTDLQGLTSQQLLQLAGQKLIEAYENNLEATSSIAYAAGSIFNHNFVINAQIAFGKDFDINKAQTWGTEVLGENYGVLPHVRFLFDSKMNGANAAYGESTNTIYINRSFLKKNIDNSTAIGTALVEEIGHFLDAYASPVDSPGDEGEILAGLVSGKIYSPTELRLLKAEDDSDVFKIGRQYVDVELSINAAPTSLQFNLNKTNLKTTETLSINGGWVYDTNGATDLSFVDFWIEKSDGTFVDVADATSFTPWSSNNLWGGFNYSLSLGALNLTSGNYSLWAKAYDKAGASTDWLEKAFSINTAPTSLQFNLNSSSVTTTGTLSINGGWVYDTNGATDLSRVDFWLKKSDGTFVDVANVTSFTPWSSNNLWGSFNYSLSLGALNLTAGNYSLWAKAYDKAGASTDWLEKAFSITQNNISFSSFNVFDAAGDSTNNIVFQGGAIRLNYGLSNGTSLSNVRLEAVKSGSIFNLGTWSGASLSNALINLNNFSSLTGGDYLFRAVARSTSGQDFFSSSQSIKILSWSQAGNTTYGTFAANTLNYSGALGTGTVVVGRGGTDTLNLSSIARANVTNINGVSLGSFNSLSSTNQAIFRGTAFDYLTLADGREIYFQGIENLRFSDNSTLELQVRTNDTYYKDQWNLRVSDVDSAWRFTRGSTGVLLVSLDTGILTAPGATGGITDISTGRLITDATDDDNFNDYGHGHSATSVMASIANNSSGIAGINWNSSVYMTDVYNGVNLQQGIKDAISYARARNLRVVFQGGVQGEGWLTSGGTQAQLEQLIKDNSDIAIFAVAAGNGGPGGNINDPNYLTSVSGVAKLQTTHSNVMSVGALQRTSSATVNGLSNAAGVNIASYSNRGSNLTLMAATDSPAMNKFGNMSYFGGTSCANPNMAGITSLVWSVNSNLNGGQLRQILIDTATDLGTAGKDNTFGNGVVNADAAVRRALALSRNNQLASLYSGRSQFA
ncbi:S8 family serine peptidase [Anabaena azotica]|uniref:S8 family serine peptidase n=1 Tax=Anabaena azotica TaxID=197653 RepID=UPI0039A5B2DA